MTDKQIGRQTDRQRDTKADKQIKLTNREIDK